ncbi:hypothetical protein ILUMI_04078 [Ignelater luminosus]|uniref:THAP-type domain-containing protein n=1 Tax=Ignelater luminosus TaxID=2038154 RepID=A0A8K0GEW8_IGNLU|nr:hypothetical protein ILUMI_04078 [Ignelater luminosus]
MSLMSEIKTKKCSVRGCVDNVSRRHRFPNPRKISETIIEAWRENTNNPSLANLSHDQLHKSFYVCDRHFTSSDIVCGLRGLKVDAVPTEFLHKVKAYTNKQEYCMWLMPLVVLAQAVRGNSLNNEQHIQAEDFLISELDAGLNALEQFKNNKGIFSSFTFKKCVFPSNILEYGYQGTF